jgi:hypothetical protein
MGLTSISAVEDIEARPLSHNDRLSVPWGWLPGLGGHAQRSLPRPGGGRPRSRGTRGFDRRLSRREPFQRFWVSVELLTQKLA